MKPDQDTINADISISTHRIVAALLRDADDARREIASESRTLFLLGAAHVDRELGKVRSRRLSEPSVDRVVPLMAARSSDGYGSRRSAGERRTRRENGSGGDPVP